MSARTTVKSIQDIMRQDAGVDGDAQRLSQLCWMFFLKIIDDQDQELEVMQEGYRSPIPEYLQWRTWAADPEGITGEELLEFINNELFPGLKELPIKGNNANRCRVVRSVFEDAYNYMKSGQLMRQVVNKINSVDFNDLSDRKHFGDIYEQLLNDLQSAGNAGEYYTPRGVTAFMVDRIDPKPGELLLDTSCGTGGFLTCSMRHMRSHYVKTVEDEQAMQASLRAVEKKPLPHMLCVTNMLLHGIEDPSFVQHDNTLARPYISYGQSDRVDIILTNPPFGGKEEDGIESNFPAHFRTKETADLFLALFIRLLKPGGRAGIVLPDGSLFGEGVKTRLKEQLLEECNLHTIVRLPNSVFKPYANIGTNLLFFEKGEPTKEIWFYEHRVPSGQKAYSMTKPIRVEHFQDCVDWWGRADRQDRQETEQAWKVSIEEIKARNYNLDFKNPNIVADDHGDPAELLAKLEQDEQKAASLRDQLKASLADAAAAMNAEQLLQHFKRIIEAPDSIPRLRRFILDLAVRGKLVEQDPSDEPATELLAWIKAEKNYLVAEGGLRSAKPLPVITEAETPFTLPKGWVWSRLADITTIIQGFPFSSEFFTKESGSGYPLIKIGDIGSNKPDVFTNEMPDHRYLVDRGDILLGLSGSIKCSIWNGPRGLLNQRIARIRPAIIELSVKWQLYAVNSCIDKWKQETSKLTVQNVKAAQLYRAVVPLPPLAEQHRIVAKVDELMAICDQLEAQITEKEQDSRRFLEAVLNETLSPALAEAV